jgi:hypothetical protein
VEFPISTLDEHDRIPARRNDVDEMAAAKGSCSERSRRRRQR